MEFCWSWTRSLTLAAAQSHCPSRLWKPYLLHQGPLQNGSYRLDTMQLTSSAQSWYQSYRPSSSTCPCLGYSYDLGACSPGRPQSQRFTLDSQMIPATTGNKFTGKGRATTETNSATQFCSAALPVVRF